MSCWERYGHFRRSMLKLVLHVWAEFLVFYGRSYVISLKDANQPNLDARNRCAAGVRDGL